MIATITTTLNDEYAVKKSIQSYLDFVDHVFVFDLGSEITTNGLEKIFGAKIHQYDLKASFGTENALNVIKNQALDKVTQYFEDSIPDNLLILDMDPEESLSRNTKDHFTELVAAMYKNRIEGTAFSLSVFIDYKPVNVKVKPTEIKLFRFTGTQYCWGGQDKWIAGINNVRNSLFDIERYTTSTQYEERQKLFDRMHALKERKSTPAMYYHKINLPEISAKD